MAQLKHPGRAVAASRGDQEVYGFPDAPGQGQAAGFALQGNQRLWVAEVADQRHAQGVGLGEQLQAAAEGMAAFEEVRKPARCLMTVPGPHETVQVRLNPAPQSGRSHL